jgi:2-dehydropantoate 2-reductase
MSVGEASDGGPPVRICIVGFGAIGSLFGAHLATLPDVEVWAYDVAREHVDAVNAGGLAVTGHSTFVSRLRASTEAGEIPPCQYGIVATKFQFTEAAMAATAGIFADAAVASVQNGIGNEEIIAGFVPRVIRGTTLPAGAITAPGTVNFDAPGDTWLGPFEPKPASMAEVGFLADALTRGGLNTHALADARGAQWTKLLFNASTNALGAITGLSTGQLCDIPRLRAMVSALIVEGREIATAQGITLDGDPEKLIDQAVATAYFHKASMLQDVMKRRPTEVDVLNGGIVRAAAEVGLTAPLNELVTALVIGLEQSWSLQ